jgi:outer membrane protein OmpA-like peptidoglycan-associated protein
MGRILLIFFLFASLASNSQEEFAVYFDVDKAIANVDSQKRLQEWMRINKNITVTKIIGYADSTWTTEYNARLSRRRADFVLNQLRTNNIPISSTIEVKGFGETTLFSENRSSDRIVIIYYELPKPESVKDNNKLTNDIRNARIGDKLRLNNLNFYGDSGRPLPQSAGVLEELLKLMRDHPTLQIEIQGHICCSGSDPKGVSEMRVKTIYNYLLENGIDEERLHYRAFGSSKPLYSIPENNEEERIANRRVEIEIMSK